MKDILAEWIQQGLKLRLGEEIYIPSAHKNEQKDFYRDLRSALSLYRKVDPVGGTQVRLYMTFKDKQYWVVMKKTQMSPLVGFKKAVDGSVSKVTISDKEMERIQKLKELDKEA